MTVETLVFNPNQNYTITGTSSSVAQAISQPSSVGATGAPVSGGGANNLRVFNNAAVAAGIAWVCQPSGTATASIGSISTVVVPSGGVETFNCGGPPSSVAAILATATSGSIYISIGNGA